MVIWYWYRKYGKEAGYLKRHDPTKAAPEPVSLDIINRELASGRIPVTYVGNKAVYDPHTKRLQAVNWQPIVDSLLAGCPVVYFSDITEGKADGKTHAFVLTGYDRDTGLFWANDTYFRKIPMGKDKSGRLIWSKRKLPAVNLQILGNEANPIPLTKDNLDRHKRPNKQGYIFFFVRVKGDGQTARARDRVARSR